MQKDIAYTPPQSKLRSEESKSNSLDDFDGKLSDLRVVAFQQFVLLDFVKHFLG